MWQKKRRPHFYGINISSRNVDNVHAKDTYVTISIEYGSCSCDITPKDHFWYIIGGDACPET